jgi:CheY-like chemotaxis protein
MDIWKDPAFDKSILGIAQAYGPYEFWTQNLQPGMNPEAAWRGLLVVAALKDRKFAPNARNLLGSADSRVRAWACFALAHLKDETALEQILVLREDPAPRVRFHARRAAQHISGKPVPPGRPLYGHGHMGVHAGPLILVSDDDPEAGKRMLGIFGAKGYRVTQTFTESETLANALRLKPQAIITDNQKGGDNLSGLNMTWDLCRNPQLRETVVFMHTADLVEIAFLWNGGDWFIRKLAREDLGKQVAEYLL